VHEAHDFNLIYEGYKKCQLIKVKVLLGILSVRLKPEKKVVAQAEVISKTILSAQHKPGKKVVKIAAAGRNLNPRQAEMDFR
jgi:hypothetical protein